MFWVLTDLGTEKKLSYKYLMEIGIRRKLSCCHGDCCCHGNRVAGVLLKQHLLSLCLDVLLQATQVVGEGVVLVSGPLSSNIEPSAIQETAHKPTGGSTT